MKKNEILTKISANYPDKWKFITSLLGKNEIEDIVSNWAEASENPERKKMFDGLELEIEQKDVSEDCMHFLLRQASKMMWANISKDQVNSILNAMDSVKAISIRLADGGDYTAQEIMEYWKKANAGK